MGVILWLIQRISAIFMMLYVSMAYMFFGSQPFTYEAWIAFFLSAVGKASFIVFSLIFSIHAIVGLWVISTDYIHCVLIRRCILLAYTSSIFFTWLLIVTR